MHESEHKVTLVTGKIDWLQATVGLIAMAFGLFGFLGPLLAGKGFEGIVSSLVCAVIITLPCCAVGLCLLSYRSGSWIDLDTKNLVVWSSLLWMHKKVTTTPLDQFQAIVVADASTPGTHRSTYRSISLEYKTSETEGGHINQPVRSEVQLLRFKNVVKAAEKAAQLGELLSLQVKSKETRIWHDPAAMPSQQLVVKVAPKD